MLGFRLLKSADRQLVLNLVQSNRPDGRMKENAQTAATIFETLGIRRTTLCPYLTEDDIASSSHRDRNQSFG
jgi:hypothetical protein